VTDGITNAIVADIDPPDYWPDTQNLPWGWWHNIETGRTWAFMSTVKGHVIDAGWRNITKSLVHGTTLHRYLNVHRDIRGYGPVSSITWSYYIVECVDGTLYTGIAKDVQQRIMAHNKGEGAKYTRARRPVTLLYACEAGNHSAALKLEYAIKQLSRAEKLKWIHDQQQNTASSK
jgi:putative endonuclease